MTLRVNFPERSVMVPITFPLTIIFTPTNVSLVPASVTVPEMVVWASAMVVPKETSKANDNTEPQIFLVKFFIGYFVNCLDD